MGEERVTVRVVTDRESLALWEEARAYDPAAIAYALFESAWSLGGDDGEVMVLLSVRKAWFDFIVKEMGRHPAWGAEALVQELNVVCEDLIEERDRKIIDDMTMFVEIADDQVVVPRDFATTIEEDDIPF